MIRTFRGGPVRTGSVLVGVATLAAAALVSGAQAVPSASASQTTPTPAAAGSTPVCAPPSGPGGHTTATTLDVISEAYRCILTNYYSGSVLDDRTLLTGAFAGMTQELERWGTDLPFATLPALSGDRDADWAAFSAVAGRVLSAVPADARQPVAAATVHGMVAALNDNHAHWVHPDSPPPPIPGPGYAYGLGFRTNPSGPLVDTAPAEAVGPLYISSVQGGPAADAGLRPGDVIEAIDGAPPFVDGVPSQGAMDALNQPYPATKQVALTVRRPVNGRTWTVKLLPAVFKLAPGADATVTSKLLPGHIGYVSLTGFEPHVADQVLQAIAALEKGDKREKLRGLVIDVRGNGGGMPAEVARLLGAFEHDKPYAYDCDAAGTCTPVMPDAGVPILHLPLTVLTDRNCASACDAFTAAVKDLGLGTVIGTRTSGIVAGSAGGYALADGSLLIMPTRHQLAANHETINGIGVAPDRFVAVTAEDLSVGRDPGLDEALEVLRGKRG